MKVLFFLLFSIGLVAVANAALPSSNAKTVLFFGDSLTAGYGLDDSITQSFPGLIQKKIIDAKLDFRVINAGLSGETTAGGLRRIDWVMRTPVDVFVLELGGNDGLRGLPTAAAMKNLQGIIEKVRAKNPAAKILIAGMAMPLSMGAGYTREFSSMYPALAKTNNATLIPFLLEDVGGSVERNQPDGVHPTAEGHRIVAETIWKTLETVLRK